MKEKFWAIARRNIWVANYLLLVCVGLAIFEPFAYWFGYIHANPVRLMNNWLDALDPDSLTQMPTEISKLGDSWIESLGGMSWLFFWVFLGLPVRYVRDVASEPSFEAYKAKVAEKERLKAAERTRETELGILVGFQAVPGGMFGRDMTIVETDSLFVRVDGYVGNATKGARVWRVRDEIYIAGLKRPFLAC